MKNAEEFSLHQLNILLADDDKDDCLFFKDALDELQLCNQLTMVHNGEQLMQLLTNLPAGRHGNSNESFDVLFLDLNMPRKNGFACLEEIKSNDKIKSLPVVITSTSNDQSIIDLLYKKGAMHYICKPSEFKELKRLIYESLLLLFKTDYNHRQYSFSEI